MRPKTTLVLKWHKLIDLKPCVRLIVDWLFRVAKAGTKTHTHTQREKFYKVIVDFGQQE